MTLDVTGRFGLRVVEFEPGLDLPPELSTDLSTGVWLLTSIARPSRLYNQLICKGMQVLGHSLYPDHHRFSDSDLRSVGEAARKAGAGLVLTTAKDRVRIRQWPEILPLRTAELRLTLRSPDTLSALIEPLLEKAVAS